jgi:hypothetical protein
MSGAENERRVGWGSVGDGRDQGLYNCLPHHHRSGSRTRTRTCGVGPVLRVHLGVCMRTLVSVRDRISYRHIDFLPIQKEYPCVAPDSPDSRTKKLINKIRNDGDLTHHMAHQYRFLERCEIHHIQSIPADNVHAPPRGRPERRPLFPGSCQMAFLKGRLTGLVPRFSGLCCT